MNFHIADYTMPAHVKNRILEVRAGAKIPSSRMYHRNAFALHRIKALRSDCPIIPRGLYMPLRQDLSVQPPV